MQKNVVLIVVDQMRSDCLGVNSNKIVETPYLDMFATKGYNFKNAYAAVPSCIASRAALLTGLDQKNHGRVGYEDSLKWTYENMLADIMTRNNYHSHCVGKMHVYPERSLCGFNSIELHDGYLHNSRDQSKSYNSQYVGSDDYLCWLKERKGTHYDLIDSGLDCNSWMARPWPYEEEVHPTNWVVTKGIDFFRKKDPNKPLFLKLSFVRPHSPLDPPKYYYDMYINQELDKPIIGEWVKDSENINEPLTIDASKGKLNDNLIHRAKAAYYGSITHIDHQIGRFWMALKEYGMEKDTVIVFVSDHGDLMGDHNLLRKSYSYQGSVNVPLIIYHPSINKDNAKSIDDVVEIRDIMPTILDCAGINEDIKLDGESLLKLINKTDKWRKYIHGEHANGIYSQHYIVTKEYKYIWFSQTGEEQLFNLIEDRNEIYNIIKDNNSKNIAEELRAILIEELKDREEGYSDGEKLLVGKKVKSSLDSYFKNK